ncbi:hypothetical protein GQ43DRAFT_383560, partial [Delitschia confertaspora ATCC 74209]
PPGINVLHVDRLRINSSDPFASQQNDDTQSAPILIEGAPEPKVETIMAEVYYQRKLFYEVKSTGYALTAFEPAENLQENVSLDELEQRTVAYRTRQDELIFVGFRRGNEG